MKTSSVDKEGKLDRPPRVRRPSGGPDEADRLVAFRRARSALAVPHVDLLISEKVARIGSKM